MSKEISVSLKVRAVDYGYIKGRIIRPGEEFHFNGMIKADKGLAPWMEAVNPADLDKYLVSATEEKVEATEEVKAPKAKPSKSKAKKEVVEEAPAEEAPLALDI